MSKCSRPIYWGLVKRPHIPLSQEEKGVCVAFLDAGAANTNTVIREALSRYCADIGYEAPTVTFRGRPYLPSRVVAELLEMPMRQLNTLCSGEGRGLRLVVAGADCSLVWNQLPQHARGKRPGGKIGLFGWVGLCRLALSACERRYGRGFVERFVKHLYSVIIGEGIMTGSKKPEHSDPTCSIEFAPSADFTAPLQQEGDKS